MNRLLNPCADPTFKALFTQDTKESNKALTSFLSSIFQTEVTEVRIIQNELPVEAENEKQTRFDINCKMNDEYVNLEMQGQNHRGSFNSRCEYHAAHLLNHCVRSSNQWNSVPRVFQISVMNFIYDKTESKGINHYYMQTKDGKALNSRLNIIFLEIPKLIKKNDYPLINLTAVEKWAKFFAYAASEEKSEYLKELSESEEGIMSAKAVLDRLSIDDVQWKIEDDYFMNMMDKNTFEYYARKEGLEEGRKEGLKEGKEEATLEAAVNFYNSGVAAETIEKCTGIKESEILMAIEKARK